MSLELKLYFNGSWIFIVIRRLVLHRIQVHNQAWVELLIIVLVFSVKTNTNARGILHCERMEVYVFWLLYFVLFIYLFGFLPFRMHKGTKS